MDNVAKHAYLSGAPEFNPDFLAGSPFFIVVGALSSCSRDYRVCQLSPFVSFASSKYKNALSNLNMVYQLSSLKLKPSSPKL